MTPTLREGPSPFLEGTCIQFAWDSTCLGALKKCPRYYQLMMIEGWKPKDTRFHLEFGIYFTNACEHYDQVRAQGMNHEDAVFESVANAMEATWVNDGVYDSNRDQIGHPWETNDPQKNRFTLIRSIVWYLDQYEHDNATTVIAEDGTPLVERSFSMELDWGPQEGHEQIAVYDEVNDPGHREVPKFVNQPYLLCGHLDKVVSFTGHQFVLDHKTTKSTIGSYYFDQYEPNNQMSLYTLAGKIIFESPVKGVIIDAVQSVVGFTRAERGLTYRTQGQLDEWLFDLKYWFRQAEQYATDEYWPMNDVACFNCDFNRHGKKICAKDPSVRTAFLKTHFTQDDPWNPLLKRN